MLFHSIERNLAIIHFMKNDHDKLAKATEAGERSCKNFPLDLNRRSARAETLKSIPKIFQLPGEIAKGVPYKSYMRSHTMYEIYRFLLLFQVLKDGLLPIAGLG